MAAAVSTLLHWYIKGAHTIIDTRERAYASGTLTPHDVFGTHIA